MNIVIGPPSDISSEKRAAFIDFVGGAGEVDRRTLPGLFDAAALLIMFFDQEAMVGTAAVKTPFVQHRRGEFAKAQVADLAEGFPLELGWVVVHSSYRKRGYGHALVAEAARQAPASMYATTKTKSMHAILVANGFEPLGVSYPSVRTPKSLLTLFGRRA